MGKFINLTGLTFGSLKVLSISEQRNKNGGVKWICECACGRMCMVHSYSLTSKHTKTCGQCPRRKAIFEGDIVKIPLTKGYTAIVDRQDYDTIELLRGNWNVRQRKYSVYAECRVSNSEVISMHRLITNAPKEKEVDHIDHDGLNNRKNNLRLCTHKQNVYNCKKRKNKTTSKYKGVFPQNSKWTAQIKCKKLYNLGTFLTQEEAALAYNEKAIKLFGEFACLNQV